MGQNVSGAQVRVIADGGVTSAKGFKAAGVHAGFRKNPERLDCALVAADEACPAAGVFTTNRFCAAPVQVNRQLMGAGGFVEKARCVAINSGNANAATGEPGLAAARRTREMAAAALGCAADEVLVASTGVIGQQLDLTPYDQGLPDLAARLSADAAGAHDAAHAIMTTDTHPKEHAVAYAEPELGGAEVAVGGMVKGSGMIMPNMATMICVLTTDAPVAPQALAAALRGAVKTTFNKVTVDSDTSTNDTCVLFASGAAAPGAEPIREGSEAFSRFAGAVHAVCEHLAREVARDGEGATRLVTVTVEGAASEADADAAARTVANSPLVKTAICGHDANWGRIAAALGRSGAAFEQTDVSIDIMGMPVCRKGLTVPFDEDEALRRFESPEIAIWADLGAGDASTTVWTCDLTHDYVTINGDYRT